MKKATAWLLTLAMLMSLVVTSFASDSGLAVTKTTVKAGEEVSVTLKVPAVSEKMANVEYTVVFDKSAFKVADSYVAPAAPTGATISMVSTLTEANGSGKVELIFGGNNSGDNVIDMTAGYTATIPFVALDAAAAGNYEFKVINIKMTSLDEEDGFTEYDRTPAGMTETVSVTIPGAHTHVFDQKNTDAKYLASAASCTAKATYYYSCTCGEKGTATFESGETLPHTASTEWKSDEIYHWHVCTTCNAEMDKAAHNPGPAATETTPQTCTICGYEIAPVLSHTHNYTEQVATDEHKASSATCTAKTTYYYSCKCGANGTKTFEYGEPLGHSWGQHVADKNLKSAADCENPAVYYVSCGRCDARDTENTFTYGEKLGHKGGEWQSDETGHWKLCERVNCGKQFSEAPHNGGTATCQEKAKCEICGAAYGKLGAHDMDTKWSSNDTQHFHKCLTKGCDYIKDAADHSGGKATCQEKAKCDVCKAEYGDLGAHTLTKTAAKAPTCLEAGNNEYYTCSVCGKVFKDAAGTTETTVAAETLAKSTTHVVESKYATSATEHWQICKVCGTVVGKAAHKFGEADANGRKTCADCGYTVGGTGTEGHKHAAGATMGYDENNHWYKCTDANCDAHVNESAHKFGPKNTVTEGNKTITIETCSECGYVKRTETTNTTPVNPGGNKPTKPGTKDNGKTVQSGKTFDAGVGVYVGLSILSLTGSAVVIGKKRKTR